MRVSTAYEWPSHHVRAVEATFAGLLWLLLVVPTAAAGLGWSAVLVG